MRALRLRPIPGSPPAQPATLAAMLRDVLLPEEWGLTYHVLPDGAVCGQTWNGGQCEDVLLAHGPGVITVALLSPALRACAGWQ
jgi:hypothetical protein